MSWSWIQKKFQWIIDNLEGPWSSTNLRPNLYRICTDKRVIRSIMFNLMLAICCWSESFIRKNCCEAVGWWSLCVLTSSFYGHVNLCHINLCRSSCHIGTCVEFHNDGIRYFWYLLNWFYSLWCQWYSCFVLFSIAVNVFVQFLGRIKNFQFLIDGRKFVNFRLPKTVY